MDDENRNVDSLQKEIGRLKGIIDRQREKETIERQSTCQWCGATHVGVCPRVKSIDYGPTGQVKCVELFPLAAGDLMGLWQKAKAEGRDVFGAPPSAINLTVDQEAARRALEDGAALLTEGQNIVLPPAPPERETAAAIGDYVKTQLAEQTPAGKKLFAFGRAYQMDHGHGIKDNPGYRRNETIRAARHIGEQLLMAGYIEEVEVDIPEGVYLEWQFTLDGWSDDFTSPEAKGRKLVVTWSGKVTIARKVDYSTLWVADGGHAVDPRLWRHLPEFTILEKPQDGEV